MGRERTDGIGIWLGVFGACGCDLWEEAVTGPNINIIRIKIYEKHFLSWLFGKRDTGSSITIKIKDIDHVYGELTNFTVESKTFIARFTIDSVNITYK